MTDENKTLKQALLDITEKVTAFNEESTVAKGYMVDNEALIFERVDNSLATIRIRDYTQAYKALHELINTGSIDLCHPDLINHLNEVHEIL